MPLTNAQYDSIMREYDKIRLNHKKDLDMRIEEVYENIPEIRTLNDSISSISVSSVRDILINGSNDKESAKKEIALISKRKEQLLADHGYPKDYLSMSYTCKDCKDTGYIEGVKCHCLKKRIIDILYEQSNIKDVLKKENFNTFDISNYKNDKRDPSTGLTPYENIKEAYNQCQSFVKNFDKNYENLYLYGATGVGKTFLTNCIAKELIDTSHSVIYLSSIRLFDILAKHTFSKNSYDTSDALSQNLFDSDLVIIDDLGTELINNFTASAFFDFINQRHLLQKSVIISTNMSLAELRDNYSERVFSRITSNYRLLKIYGDDLRMKLR